MSRDVRRHRTLRILFKNGMEAIVQSPGGFTVSSSDGTITEPDAQFASLPYHDPNTIAAVISEDTGERQMMCPHPACMEIIEPEQYACKEHWYDLPNYVRENLMVALQNTRLRPSPRSQEALDQAEKAATRSWRKQMEEPEK